MTDELHVEYLPQFRQYVKTLTKLADVTFYKKVKTKCSNSNLNVEQSLNFILACIILNSSCGITINVLVPHCTVKRRSLNHDDMVIKASLLPLDHSCPFALPPSPVCSSTRAKLVKSGQECGFFNCLLR